MTSATALQVVLDSLKDSEFWTSSAGVGGGVAPTSHSMKLKALTLKRLTAQCQRQLRKNHGKLKVLTQTYEANGKERTARLLRRYHDDDNCGGGHHGVVDDDDVVARKRRRVVTSPAALVCELCSSKALLPMTRFCKLHAAAADDQYLYEQQQAETAAATTALAAVSGFDEEGRKEGSSIYSSLDCESPLKLKPSSSSASSSAPSSPSAYIDDFCRTYDHGFDFGNGAMTVQPSDELSLNQNTAGHGALQSPSRDPNVGDVAALNVTMTSPTWSTSQVTSSPRQQQRRQRGTSSSSSINSYEHPPPPQSSDNRQCRTLTETINWNHPNVTTPVTSPQQHYTTAAAATTSSSTSISGGDGGCRTVDESNGEMFDLFGEGDSVGSWASLFGLIDEKAESPAAAVDDDNHHINNDNRLLKRESSKSEEELDLYLQDALHVDRLSTMVTSGSPTAAESDVTKWFVDKKKNVTNKQIAVVQPVQNQTSTLQTKATHTLTSTKAVAASSRPMTLPNVREVIVLRNGGKLPAGATAAKVGSSSSNAVMTSLPKTMACLQQNQIQVVTRKNHNNNNVGGGGGGNHVKVGSKRTRHNHVTITSSPFFNGGSPQLQPRGSRIIYNKARYIYMCICVVCVCGVCANAAVG